MKSMVEKTGVENPHNLFENSFIRAENTSCGSVVWTHNNDNTGVIMLDKNQPVKKGDPHTNE